jgi:hypothetical protein
MPTFAPLRAAIVTAFPFHHQEKFLKDEHGYVLQSPRHVELPSDTEASTDFTLADLVEGESVVGGYTTRESWEMGVYTGSVKGRYLNFNGSQQGSLLWSNLCLLRGSLADDMVETHKKYANWCDKNKNCENILCAPPGPMKRTDSGTSYGVTGYPDVEFWARSGVVADAFVPAEVYQGRTDCMDPEFYVRGINLLREMNGRHISPAMQAAINKQAGHYTQKLEDLLC